MESSQIPWNPIWVLHDMPAPESGRGVENECIKVAASLGHFSIKSGLIDLLLHKTTKNRACHAKDEFFHHFVRAKTDCWHPKLLDFRVLISLWLVGVRILVDGCCIVNEWDKQAQDKAESYLKGAIRDILLNFSLGLRLILCHTVS